MANGLPTTLVDQTDGDRPYGAKSLTQSREDLLVQLGQGYTVSTNIVAVATGNYLNAILANPANSGVNLMVHSRVLSANVPGGQTPPEYNRYAAGATFPAGGSTAVTIGNRKAGSPAFAGTFNYAMGTNPLVGTSTSGGFLPTGGIEKRIKELVIIPPGSTLAYTISGSGGGLAAAARAIMTFLFVTEPV